MENNEHKRGLSRKQAKVIEIFLNNKGHSKARAIREAGYSEAMAQHPERVFASPAVVKALDARGYDTLGIALLPRAREVYDLPTPAPSTLDLSKLPLEQIQDLKERLRSLPPLHKEEVHTYKPTGDDMDLNGNAIRVERPINAATFSSM